MDRIIKHNRIITSILGVLLAFSSIILSVPNTYAENYGTAAMYPISQAVMAYGGYAGYLTGQAYNNGYDLDGTVGTTYGIDLTSASILTTTAVPANSLISFDVQICPTVSAYIGFTPQSTNIYKVSEDSQTYNGCATSHIVLYTYSSTNDFSFANNIATVQNGAIHVHISGFSVVILNSTPDNTAQINNIAQNLGLVNNNLNTINNGISDVNRNIQDVNDSVNDLGQTQEDIHEDEKETIQDAVDGAEEDAAGLTPSFSLPNPFRALFGAFSDTCTPSYPNLANLLSLPRNNHQSFWCKSTKAYLIRSINTTVISCLGVILVFTMVWKWLTKPSGESS